MTGADLDIVIRRAIGGDADAISWIVSQAETSDRVAVIAMAAVLERNPAWLTRAGQVAGTSRERQLVVIARAHLDGACELVDVLAHDHLADHPDSLIVSWIASCSAGPDQRSDIDT